jgi:NAD(P)-dependent dehydrogenase (short-subunit alcohol dehydrogenase family)
MLNVMSVLRDVDRKKLMDTVRLCAKSGCKVKDYECDVTDENAVVAMFDNAHRDLGRIDGARLPCI